VISLRVSLLATLHVRDETKRPADKARCEPPRLRIVPRHSGRKADLCVPLQ